MTLLASVGHASAAVRLAFMSYVASRVYVPVIDLLTLLFVRWMNVLEKYNIYILIFFNFSSFLPDRPKQTVKNI